MLLQVNNTDQDFVGDSQVGFFRPGGPDTTSVTFTVRNDDLPEIAESKFFSLTVIGTDAVVDAPNVAIVVIEANDDAYGFFSFVIPDVSSFFVYSKCSKILFIFLPGLK